MADGLRPLFLIKPGTMSRKDISRAERLAGICIVECGEPDAARFCEAPLGADLDEQARAALSLMRTVISHPDTNFTRGSLTKWFVAELLTWKQPPKVPLVKEPERSKTP